MRNVIASILTVIGTLLIFTGMIFQIVLSVQMYGVFFKAVVIPHWSLWFYLGFVPLLIGHVLYEIGD